MEGIRKKRDIAAGKRPIIGTIDSWQQKIVASGARMKVLLSISDIVKKQKHILLLQQSMCATQLQLQQVLTGDSQPGFVNTIGGPWIPRVKHQIKHEEAKITELISDVNEHDVHIISSRRLLEGVDEPMPEGMDTRLKTIKHIRLSQKKIQDFQKVVRCLQNGITKINNPQQTNQEIDSLITWIQDTNNELSRVIHSQKVLSPDEEHEIRNEHHSTVLKINDEKNRASERFFL